MRARLVPLAEVDGALTERWRALGRAAPEPNPFAEPDFVLPADRWVDRPAARAVVVVEHDGELRFALPVTRAPGFRRIAVPAVATWLHCYAPVGLPLVAPREPEESWSAVVRLLGGVASWAVLGLFPSDGHAFRTMTGALHAARRPVSAIVQPARPVARRRPGAAGTEGMPAKRRSELARQRRRLAEHLGGPVETVDHEAPGRDLDRAVDGFLAMEAAGWKGRDGGAMASRAGHGEFFRDMCRRFAAAGNLRLWALQVGGRPVAYQCDLVAGTSLFAFKKTFDEALGPYSPGAQLLLETVRGFHADGELDLYDSCFGSATVSHELFPDRRDMAEVLLPLSLLGWGAAVTGSAAVAAYRAARRLRRV